MVKEIDRQLVDVAAKEVGSIVKGNDGSVVCERSVYSHVVRRQRQDLRLVKKIKKSEKKNGRLEGNKGRIEGEKENEKYIGDVRGAEGDKEKDKKAERGDGRDGRFDEG